MKILKYIYSHNKKNTILNYTFTMLYAFTPIILAKLIELNISIASGNIVMKLPNLLVINLIGFLGMVFLNISSQYVSKQFYRTTEKILYENIYSLLYEYTVVDKEKISIIFTNKIELVSTNYLKSLDSIIYFIVSFLLGSTFILNINLWIYIFIIIIAFITLIVTKIASKKIRNLQTKKMQSLENLVAHIGNIYSNFDEIKILNMKKKLTKKFSKQNEFFHKDKFNLEISKSIVSIINDGLAWLLKLGVYFIGVVFILNGHLSLSSLLGTVSATETITTPIFWLSSTIIDMRSVETELNELLDILKYPQKSGYHINKLIPNIESIQFKDVMISYDNISVIKKFNFMIEKEKKYVIIGESGSGKTSIVKSILKMDLTNEENIFINNIPLKDLDLIPYYEKISYMTQISPLFLDFTLKENITLLDDYNVKSYNEIIENLKIKEIISKNQTILMGNENLTLSSGEQQRLLIARSLYMNKDLYIFDEPFSLIDERNRELILEYLTTKLSNKTIIMILNQYNQNDLNHFDYIVEVKNNHLMIHKPLEEI